MNITDKIEAANQVNKDNLMKLNEEYLKLELIANKIFSTDDGIMLLKAIKVFCKIEEFDINPNLEPQWLAYIKGRRDVYLMLLRLLNKKIRNDFERIE